MGKKYFTLSFDDGLEQDKKIILLMKKYGIKGTFNLNAGLFGERGEVKGIGNMAFADCEEGTKHKWPFKYTEHNRIPKDEIVQVYEGMEIASHGYRHEPLAKLSETDMRKGLDMDISELENLTEQHIYGHAYAKASTSQAAQAYLKEKGILYARNVMPSNSFEYPQNLMNFNPTCSCISKNIFSLLERFKSEKAENTDLLFYAWGHGYEFDFGTGFGTWEHLEKVFDTIAGQEDIVCCTNAEAFMHI